jgi:CubicO group peptidase (beta-lactamase class C family)
MVRQSLPSRKIREQIIPEILAKAPPGVHRSYLYSNLGYMVVGAALELRTGRDYEELLRTEIWTPLGIKSGGFGPPGLKDALDQPLGHVYSGNEARALPVGPSADNPPSLGPAGTVHMSLSDWALFLGAHLAGAKGEHPLLEAATWKRLQTPAEGKSYAAGWGVAERGWAKGTTLSHTGCNTLWFAVVWMAPELGRGYMAVGNIADAKMGQRLDQVVSRLIKDDLSGTLFK